MSQVIAHRDPNSPVGNTPATPTNPAAVREGLIQALVSLGEDPLDLDYLSDRELRSLYESLSA